MHEHLDVHCEHALKFCGKCNVVYCAKCQYQWVEPCINMHTQPYFTTRYPFISPEVTTSDPACSHA